MPLPSSSSYAFAVVVLTTAYAVPAICGETWSSASANEVLAAVANAENRRDSQISEMKSKRRYTISNKRWENPVVVDVLVTWDGAQNKSYRILSSNADGVRKSIVTRILDAEMEATKKREAYADFTPANYDVVYKSDAAIAGHHCRMATLVPKNPSKYTLDGEVCLDAENSAIVKISGRSSKSISFWVGRPQITQEFKQVGQFWLSAKNSSVADVRLFGQSTLTIEYLDYAVKTKSGPPLMACGSPNCAASLGQ